MKKLFCNIERKERAEKTALLVQARETSSENKNKTPTEKAQGAETHNKNQPQKGG